MMKGMEEYLFHDDESSANSRPSFITVPLFYYSVYLKFFTYSAIIKSRVFGEALGERTLAMFRLPSHSMSARVVAVLACVVR